MAKAEYRSARRSRKLINNALAELIKEKPLDKITVTDVVTRADLNRGTFYAHYTNIQDVINSQLNEACIALQKALTLHNQSRERSDTPDPTDVLQKLQEFLESDFTFYSSLLTSSVSTAAIEKIRNVFIDYMLEHESEYSVHDHDRYVFGIMFASGGIITIYQDWFNGKLPMTFDQITEHAINVTRSIAVVSSS